MLGKLNAKTVPPNTDDYERLSDEMIAKLRQIIPQDVKPSRSIIDLLSR